MIESVRNSVFLKLFLILVATGLLINFVVTTGLRFAFLANHHKHPNFMKTLDEYSSLLIEKMAQNPTPEYARTLLGNIGADMRAEGGVNWSTHEKLPYFRDLPEMPNKPPLTMFHVAPPPRMFTSKVVMLPQGKTRFTIFWGPGPEFEASMVNIGIMIFVLSSLMLVSYLAIRRTLKPLRDLRAGVIEIGKGNLNHVVPIQGKDELAQLATSLNRMTGQIRGMMQAKEQLLLDVSHELRTPVTRAKIALEMLSPNQTTEDLAVELLEMEKMVHSILEGARMDSPHGALNLAKTNIQELLNETMEKFNDSTPKVKLIEKIVKISAIIDKERMKTVLKNLIENGLKYSDSKSTVELRVSNHGPLLEFEVIDYGRGIPSGELQNIFEPFYRIDKSRTRETGGFGLGLNLCKKIVEAHGGNISIKSKEGVGTVVTICLPITPSGRNRNAA